MQVTIQLAYKELPVQTVAVSRLPDDPTNIILFRCYRCGSAIAQVQGRISRIVAGEPIGGVYIINQCHQCHQYYTFYTTDVCKTRTSLVLYHDLAQEYTTFHCVICRTQLAKYNTNGFYSLPDLVKHLLPYEIDCFSPSCTQRYSVADIV